MEQNREVFAVPGNITSRNSFGTNYLIKGAGAKLVQQWQDVVAEFPPDTRREDSAARNRKEEARRKNAGDRRRRARRPFRAVNAPSSNCFR